ncbi:MAG: family 1 glycosylhydrolase [Pyrinomonadaceae bacterium]
MSAQSPALQRPELWAGIECTVNRVGDDYFDQVERGGHAVRVRDLDRLAALGIRTLRYPVLWERTAPRGLDDIEWAWADERLSRLRQLRMQPIIGFLHHGSGPRYTGLLDPAFPEKLAEFAAAFARRYRWVTHYTPVNEPLTTARFSCLYGYWYPHARDPLLFARAVITQCRAITLSMRAIRQVNPEALLIQTEDLGRTFSTPALAYQAEFENERRWLTYDLLCGRVLPKTPMWDYFRWLGINENELDWFIDNQTSPDVLGVNHYITSERFLDERLTRYPGSTHGGNGRHSYADVEAVRVCAEGIAGPKSILKEVWERYRLPVAITEAHLGCTREEQLRWLKEIWDAAAALREQGTDIRAVTAWSAFGAFDWNSLLTRDEGLYEPGIFDLRGPTPRPTALARMSQALAAGLDYDHPTLDSAGWWHRLDRFCHPPANRRGHGLAASVGSVNMEGRPSRALLITGATGTLGQAFARICERRGLAYYLLTRQDMDIADPDSVSAALERYEPWAIVNAAGYVRVDDAEREVERCMRENVVGPTNLAHACAGSKIPLITFSSDLVFAGSQRTPYVESDAVLPLNVYGKSKAAAEQEVLDAFPGALVIRTSAFFGPWDKFNFVNCVLSAVAEGRMFWAANDVTISPTYIPDLVNVSLDLLIDGEQGVWHLANSGALTWTELARTVAQSTGYDPNYIGACANESFGLAASRPAFSVLSSERASLMRPFEEALVDYFLERQQLIPESLAAKR